MHETLGLNPSTTETGMVLHTCKLSTGKSEAGGSKIQGFLTTWQVQGQSGIQEALW